MEEMCGRPRSVRMFGNGCDGSGVERSVRQVSRHLGRVFEQAGARMPLDIEALDAAGLGTMDAIARDGARAWLSTVGHIDEAVFRHSLMVAGVMSSLLTMLRVRRDQASLLVQGALLHDIGKVRIDPRILDKPGPLDADEMAIMRTHTQHGEAIAQAAGLGSTICAMIRSHHEHLDGSGYPDGLRRGRISNAVRALTVCDIFSALVEPRSYKPALSPETAFATMRLREAHLDRELLAMLHVAFDRPVAAAAEPAAAG
ncbi:putative nucleotidyltransferase with HDIG domain [Endobacter medicaginis]|jgi:putative nucleotidyltransferase with HDIG domain|uniref:HD domain-containing protein n=1 Tax=Endobacter medicaginis TaxID=1181271 RepID=A0A839UY45_9PROT|nr:HD domain-containing phosphohydrolase [Endobacter medicaginis]MBB3172251.1 putative nucleotidyltransferase with HDIG domain [Endobacter medicaginis]MCX5474629.1 HD domain-containing protein [Endobacter medicaginis]NVN30198.1 HD domain-containing protein [Endobacter medicaginis]